MLLVCVFDLNSGVDTDVRVDVIWRKGGEVLNNDNRINITEVTLTELLTFQAMLSISPLSDALDSGQYSCQTDISSDSFVLFVDSLQQVILRIEGTATL